MAETNTITEFGSALQAAIDNKKEDLNLFVWKGKDGKEIKLMDMTKDELQRVYNHTTDMLYNTNRYTPGRYQVKKNIKILINNCNAELLLRYLLHECNIDFLRTSIQILDFIRRSKEANNLTSSDSVTALFSGLPAEFETITIDDLVNACFDKLDIINRKMISDDFILSQGIWLTEDEKKDLTEYDENNNLRPWLEVIKERLLLPNIKLRIDPKGFSYSEFRALIHLEPTPKVSKLPSNTLKLLRDKVFLLLDVDTDYHIQKWLDIKNNIESVAKAKGYDLTLKFYN